MGRWEQGCPLPSLQILVDQLTIFQSGGGQIIPTTLLLAPRFSDLPPALLITHYFPYIVRSYYTCFCHNLVTWLLLNTSNLLTNQITNVLSRRYEADFDTK